MAKNTSITLGEHFDGFIRAQRGSGRYGSASEIVRAGLRLLEDSENKLQILRQMLIQGEESGVADYNYKDFLAELDEQKPSMELFQLSPDAKSDLRAIALFTQNRWGKAQRNLYIKQLDDAFRPSPRPHPSQTSPKLPPEP